VKPTPTPGARIGDARGRSRSVPVKRDPWYKTRLRLDALGARLELGVPQDVFSTLRIDEGTRLLLDHLPEAEPRSVLDMGCGYGALGLPVAARYPQARVEMVDRDLLAVAWAARNADENHLPNAAVHGSLGFRDVAAGAFDWILCNVPARIGRPFVAHLLEAGRSRLAPGGELRLVVIRDLAPLVEELGAARRWPLAERGRGPRHAVYALPAAPGPAPPPPEPEALYLRDRVEIGGLALDRPSDLGGDDPRRLRSGLPVLLDALPRTPPRSVFCFRCGYGGLPLVARARWPGAQVVAADRDLLATTFTRRNAERLGLASERLEVREAAHFPRSLLPGERFDLAVGELSPSAGERVAASELEALARALRPGGQALVLALEKLEREWIWPLAAGRRLPVHKVIARQGYALLRLAPA
jgi:16S rRNA (guanine1207-N2)-methyltransferase